MLMRVYKERIIKEMYVFSLNLTFILSCLTVCVCAGSFVLFSYVSQSSKLFCSSAAEIFKKIFHRHQGSDIHYPSICPSIHLVIRPSHSQPCIHQSVIDLISIHQTIDLPERWGFGSRRPSSYKLFQVTLTFLGETSSGTGPRTTC